VELVKRYQTRAGYEPLVKVANDLITEVNYHAELKRQYREEEDVETRWQAVQDVVNSLADYVKNTAKPTLQGFLDSSTLDNPADKDKEEQIARNAVALMTLHAAKGLEFPEVYLVGLEEGVLPHHRSLGEGEANIEEERRLCYVGVTRARERLTLSFPLTRFKWGKARPTIPSRFIYELTGQADHPNAVKARQGKATNMHLSKGPKKSVKKGGQAPHSGARKKVTMRKRPNMPGGSR
jgi:DNA helicase-2/ATP-dependent DNA helicase PcrA